MKKLMLLLTAAVLLMALVSFTGCGDKPADETKEAEAIQVATHDCAGGCGMKDMPADKTTEVDGKFYCSGCATKAKGDHPSGHEGHNH